METYRAMKDRHQTEVNALPLAFAFSHDRYLARLAEWNITEEEAKAGAIIGIGNGGFIRSSDRDLVVDTFKRHREERQAAIEADQDGTGYIYEMFLYELANHEYGYTGDVSETLSALNFTADDINSNAALQNGLKKAAAEIGADPFGE